ncbi:MAG: iron-sulfur cluster assembly protein [Candidatus Thalassarchaeaceae archaeon]|jgi:metal-sulfur cluster biosynthetic enzyme|nr:metal-sulfur cluster biosynthetic enzyme [Euryarchaeota archaeon]MDP6220690.1 iron-sulfur cluster assembly protein [Candidatus Thalassarchaeaceae archaeon]MBV43779.1 metal-sulfur cluster biosynthetic enzyme [Euryarchaeota archaeon]MDP7092420.1 iron-sulfur cluster assembly protein [Candidatus Thalassarchaeaceae archaeon]MDP7256593.1 iron-sulfur cluster assembly protein [Candidatus Thalassarchaeaceae archaeon]|tara:strand:+ start:2325 stop:2627 length:303 start_codon:yes stop_codon:yes gene_type:complete
MVEEGDVMASLVEVEDPEMKLSVIDLGLIYSVRIEGDHAEIDMTLTSPGCPVAPELMAAVHRSALSTNGIESVHVNLTFTPLWDPKVHATEDGKFELGIF